MDGWTQYSDDSGRPYWYNSTTGESTWTDPQESVYAVTAPAPAAPVINSSANDWEMHQSSDGTNYYYNRITQESSWDEPAGYALLSAPPISAPVVTSSNYYQLQSPSSPAPSSPANNAVSMSSLPASCASTPCATPLSPCTPVSRMSPAQLEPPEVPKTARPKTPTISPGSTMDMVSEGQLHSLAANFGVSNVASFVSDATKEFVTAVDPRSDPLYYDGSYKERDKSHHSYYYVPLVFELGESTMKLACRKLDRIRDLFFNIEAAFSCANPDIPGIKCVSVSVNNEVLKLDDIVGSLKSFTRLQVEKTAADKIKEARDKTAEMDFRSKRKLKVVTMAGDAKTIMVDDGIPVRVVLEQIAGKIGLIHHSEFRLFVIRNKNAASVMGGGAKGNKRNNNTATMDLPNPLYGTSGDIIEDGSATTIWLKLDDTLNAQGVKMSDTVYLKRRFFYYDDSVYTNDPVALKLVYVQSMKAILSGELECDPRQALVFAALQLQITKGDYSKEGFNPKKDKITDVLFEEHTKQKKARDTIMFEWEKLRGIKPENAQYFYVKLFNSLPMWGISLFEGKISDSKKKKLIPQIVGINRTEILKIDFKTRAVEERWLLKHMHHYAHSAEFFKLYYDDSEVLVLLTDEADYMSQLIDGYLSLILSEKTEQRII